MAHGKKLVIVSLLVALFKHLYLLLEGKGLNRCPGCEGSKAIALAFSKHRLLAIASREGKV